MLARFARHAAPVVAGIWGGVLVCIGALAAPTAFSVLSQADAGRLVGCLFSQEAYLSLGVGIGLLIVEQQRHRRADESGEAAGAGRGSGSAMSAEVLLLLGALFCTVAGYFAVQPLMDAARVGRAGLSFGAFHAVSAGMFALKALMVLALAWRLAAITSSAKIS